ncbi:MAG TPA: murein biosynthesis integral membrane protein MurJ [Acidobacteriaceae bacterium]|nr:murein biosynthesis integral membrane protein MurJ [Acidobacteriaceae bacterium]
MSSSSIIPRWRRALSVLNPSHRHSAFTAALLLMSATMASSLVGLVRTKYIAWLLGRSAAADAFIAAFQLPDMLRYFLVGGALSITFVTILTHYREQGRDAEGERAMSVILTAILLVVGSAMVLAELAAPALVHVLLRGFNSDPAKAALCVHLTRILFPAQLFFISGGVFAAVLMARKQFAVQAVTPLIYNCGIIFGGVLLYRHFGVSALAVGAVAGAFLGPFLLNAIWAHRAGMRYRPILEWRNEGLREWVRMSVPLMLGVSLVTADNWIISFFASHVNGAVALLAYAKQLVNVPVLLGQAAGTASLPFLASLYVKPDRAPFSRAVNSSVSKILAFSILLTGFLIAMALPAVDVVFRGGRFHRADSGTLAVYFAIFAISLCLWSAQAIYARAFYAAGNTLTPMVAGTIVTVVSLPVYWSLYQAIGPAGLAIASDIGILIQTLTLAVLLHWRRVVSLGGLEYGELLRSVVAAGAVYATLAALRHFAPTTSRIRELELLLAGAVIWVAVSGAVLKLTGSELPNQLLSRFRWSKPA